VCHFRGTDAAAEAAGHLEAVAIALKQQLKWDFPAVDAVEGVQAGVSGHCRVRAGF
jgi:hypothetical protein